MRSLYESILDDDEKISRDLKKACTDLYRIIDTYLKYIEGVEFRGFGKVYNVDRDNTLYMLSYIIDKESVKDNYDKLVAELEKLCKKIEGYKTYNHKNQLYICVVEEQKGKKSSSIDLNIHTNQSIKNAYLTITGRETVLELIKDYIQNKIK